jgi:hypothetical protein
VLFAFKELNERLADFASGAREGIHGGEFSNFTTPPASEFIIFGACNTSQVSAFKISAASVPWS